MNLPARKYTSLVLGQRISGFAELSVQFLQFSLQQFAGYYILSKELLSASWCLEITFPKALSERDNAGCVTWPKWEKVSWGCGGPGRASSPQLWAGASPITCFVYASAVTNTIMMVYVFAPSLFCPVKLSVSQPTNCTFIYQVLITGVAKQTG